MHFAQGRSYVKHVLATDHTEDMRWKNSPKAKSHEHQLATYKMIPGVYVMGLTSVDCWGAVWLSL